MHHFTVKIVDVCNLNCTYCSYFTSTYRPLSSDKIMPIARIEAALQRIREFLDERRLRAVSLLWHGGEPTLVKVAYFESIAASIKKTLDGIHILNRIGTNGVLIDQHWIDFAQRE